MRKIVFTVLFGLLCIVSCSKKAETAQDDTIIIKTGMDTEERTGDELKIAAIMTVKPEAIKDMLPIFQAVVQGSQEEDGCIFYNVHQDINDSTRFIILEEWESQAAIDLHGKTDHFKTYQEASKNLIEKKEVIKMKLVY
ncbi:MAG: putative quinol monooxygenase [Dysgonomonas sp.]|jgi:quinol monooxygenase YgiN|uniref:putative quinol monooxygenase n=1 Tax=unclassified Dysgonomonas TaxID=2630389 RepID=UPI0025BBFE63|nr:MULTISPECIES: putative quinol monooxygenase [unclassified Dysgonomonas]MDR1718224.1 antibiotic biosynthesis monooxygenase [Prevotella sp.]MDR2003256.1 antibiotic biosynthesis monooxygenase [Prevotella sp.]HMM03023.1 putative quinol monooxygenase [Dysgonomonas sp.]